MTGLKVIGYLSLIIFAVGLGWLASVNNTELIQVNFVFWKSPEINLGLVLVVVLAVGCLLGIFTNGFMLWRSKRQRNKLKKQLDSALQRFEQLQ